MDKDRTIETLIDFIERLMELLKETAKAEEAQEIYKQFFGA